MINKKTVLVAPLHWGLGHATRCIPIIKALLLYKYTVIIASDGGALLLLQKEFPTLESLELPSYNITYPKKGGNFKISLLLKLPDIRKTILQEKRIIKQLVSERKIDGIISDNRFGVYHKNIPSVYITHQIKVLSGNTTYFSSRIHEKTIKKFNECWVPDIEGSINLSGEIGHTNLNLATLKYIGVLSRMKKMNIPLVYDILILLSGPEPQRTILEVKLIELFKDTDQNVLLVRGVIEEKQIKHKLKNIKIVNFMKSSELEKTINESDKVISRSGYTTIMDLIALEKKAFLIPTPGQFEQEFLAKRLKELGVFPSCRQNNFSVDKLNKLEAYTIPKHFKSETDYKELFSLFERKRKL